MYLKYHLHLYGNIQIICNFFKVSFFFDKDTIDRCTYRTVMIFFFLWCKFTGDNHAVITELHTLGGSFQGNDRNDINNNNEQS